ncbi:MAG: 3-coathanger stack domain-containing protein [Bacteroidota bacterium]
MNLHVNYLLIENLTILNFLKMNQPNHLFQSLLSFLFVAGLIIPTQIKAQNYYDQSRGFTRTGAEIIQGEYKGLTVALRNYREDPNALNEITKTEKLGYHPKDDWILNEQLNPNAQPKNGDPIRQRSYPPRRDQKALLQNFGGIGYTSVNPSDPCIDVGPNHVIQMINGGSGAYFEIYDKSGGVLINQTYLDNYLGFPGGSGDPIVLYDQNADRWMMSEFANAGNNLHVAISQTSDPTGSWHTYIYNTPNFPDYPKYGIWNDAYIITTNESGPNAIYALDRNKLLNGTTNNAQRFTVPTFGTIGFQALTPIDVDGTTNPSASDPPLIMRMVDDAWDSSVNNDMLEFWEVDVDFNNANNSSISLSLQLNTTAFDTELCGYTSFSCIDQPSSNTNLDPLREVIMNKAHYRSFGSYESIVCTHVTDVTGNDDAGVRWYELRKSGGSNWSIYQEGTYSPDSDSRWMSSIAINSDGSIGLMYNVSSSTTFPSIRYTGRKECDPLGTMTEPETEVVTGTAPNSSNRYGDYNCMVVDPSDQSFWLTAQYNPASQWDTHIGQFDIGSCTPRVEFNNASITVNEEDADVDDGCRDYQLIDVGIGITLDPSAPADITVSVNGGTATELIDFEISNNIFTLDGSNLSQNVQLKIYDDAFLEGTENLILDYTLNANGGDAITGTMNQTFSVTINEAEYAPTDPIGFTLSEDFETSGSLGTFTTINPSGDTPFQQGSTTEASSTFFTVPSGTNVAYINDDDCNCNQNEVRLISSSLDLSFCQSMTLDFELYFEGNTFQGDTEIGKLQVSIGGGAWADVQTFTGDDSDWQNISVDLAAYIGNPDVRFAFFYSDGGGWLYGMVIDNVMFNCQANVAIQTAVNSNTPTEHYFGPNATVHFYDESSGNIMLTLVNNSNFDYGCTTVEVDRQGTNPTTQAFSTNTPADYLMSKTFKVTPTNNNPNGSYDLSLYYKENEVATWETQTGQNRSNAAIVKVAGNNQISDVTPANYTTFNIYSESSTTSSFNSDVIFSATFTNGFSGFGIGLPVNNNASTGVDSDSDGVPDISDNCPWEPNANQTNADGDNFGEACDCDDSNPNDEDITINNNPITPDTYDANTSITSAGNVPASSIVSFQAGESISLETNFIANQGSNFIARIDSCTTTTPAALTSQIEDDLIENLEDTEKKKENTDGKHNIDLDIIPNPFSSEVLLTVHISQGDKIDLAVFDARGNQIKKIIDQRTLEQGQHSFTLKADNLSGGIFFAVLRTSQKTIVKKMIRID